MLIRIPLDLIECEPQSFTKIKVDARSYWVRKDVAGKVDKVLLDKCAHMGSPLVVTAKGFTCRSHGWIYDHDGRNTALGSPALQQVSFVVSGDYLELDINEATPLLIRKGELVGDETLELLSHASFLLRANGRSILFDPWLVDSAYWGSWIHFPSRAITPEEIEVTDIIITHPHPDHFHIPTLKRLPRDARIFIPNFESGIMQQELKRLGFTNVHCAEWEKVIELDNDIEFAFLRPVSLWEDSSCLVRVKDWIWLNQNDSGAALQDDLIPERVNLLSTSFDIGASGYPLTWEIPDGRKISIIKASKRNLLEAILRRCEQVRADHYSPFAGWWRHGLVEHQEMASKLEHTSLEDLRQLFEGSNTALVETIPSSKVVLKTMSHSWDVDCKLQLSAPSPIVKITTQPRASSDEDLASKVSQHLINLQGMSIASNSEAVLFEVSIPEIGFALSVPFGAANEQVLVKISAEIPAWIAELLVGDDSTATWNHVDIGYWISWERSPDVYPVNFMRLLQLGYVEGLRVYSRDSDDEPIDKKSIAELMEIDPELVTSILSRAGLPCASCTRKNSDSLGNAFEIHKVPEQLKQRSRAMLSGLIST
jgi:hypothetical protein